eukprot:gene7417-549_t
MTMRLAPASEHTRRSDAPVGRHCPTRFTIPRGLIRAQAYQYESQEHGEQPTRKLEKLPLQNISTGYDPTKLMMNMEVKGYKTIDQDLLYVHDHVHLLRNILSLEEDAELRRHLPDPRVVGRLTTSHSFGSRLMNQRAKDLLAYIMEVAVNSFRESDVLGPLRVKRGNPMRVRQQTGKAKGTRFHSDTEDYDCRFIYRIPHAPKGKQSSSLLLHKKTKDKSGEEKHMALQIPLLAGYIMDDKISRGAYAHGVPGEYYGSSIIFDLE